MTTDTAHGGEFPLFPVTCTVLCVSCTCTELQTSTEFIYTCSKTQGGADANGATHTQNADRDRAKQRDGTDPNIHRPEPRSYSKPRTDLYIGIKDSSFFRNQTNIV